MHRLHVARGRTMHRDSCRLFRSKTSPRSRRDQQHSSLRPESLETEGLVAALTKQGAALHARHSITIQTDLCEEPDLPIKVKQELYRVAQEALHNIVKHARASSVYLRLGQTTSREVVLEVRDNGVGFDPARSFPGHLGLRSMQERIRSLDGTFQLESMPGQGTCIRVCILVL